jgi:enoyl-CoA hydratase
MTGDLLVEARGPVLVMTINRPERRNAMDGAAARALASALDRLDADDSVAVGVLTGAGGTFCAGMDLKAFLDGDLPDLPGRGMGGLTEAPPGKPLIAAVEGWALAGGFEIVLACDLVVAAEGARFGLPEVKRALVAGGGGVLHLSRQLPHAAAMELLLTGDPIGATRAYELGLINRVVPDGTALADALAYAETIAANGPLAVRVTKQIARRVYDWSSTDQWTAQRELMARVFASDDAREGAAAFAEKRAPRWTGR